MRKVPAPVTPGAVIVMVPVAAAPAGSAIGSAQISWNGAASRAMSTIATSIEPRPNCAIASASDWIGP